MRAEYETPRLRLRAWTPADAPALKAAVDASLDHLRPWLPWTTDEPTPLDGVAERLARFADDFAAGRWWGYGIHARDAAPAGAPVLGGAGVHPPREDDQPPSVREVGYWLRAGATGRGYMTEAAGALVDAALAEPGVLAVEIRCDPANVASARVPARLGFALRERRVADRVGADGTPRDTLVWERRVSPWRLRPATPADLPRLAAIRSSAAAARDGRPAPADRDPDDSAAVARGACWVWADEGGVWGFASGLPAGGGPGGAEPLALLVDPAAHGRGAWPALLALATDAFWRAGHRHLTLTTAPGREAERLSGAAGWAEVGRSADGEVAFRRAL